MNKKYTLKVRYTKPPQKFVHAWLIGDESGLLIWGEILPERVNEQKAHFGDRLHLETETVNAINTVDEPNP